jgi:hypothetical protein
MVQIVYPSEASSIPYQLIVLIISVVIFASITTFLRWSLKAQKNELIYKLTKKLTNEIQQKEIEKEKLDKEIKHENKILEDAYRRQKIEQERVFLKEKRISLEQKKQLRSQYENDLCLLQKAQKEPHILNRRSINELEKIVKNFDLLDFFVREDSENKLYQ